MAGTFKEIDYRLRPAKHAERMMMADLFARLSLFETVRDYQYIGLGSVYFSDFMLFHRALGMETMVNIEGAAQTREQEERFRSNAPLAIDLRFGWTTKILPDLPLERRTITWLDYDSRLNADCMSDLALVASKCASGSALAITVTARPRSEDEEGSLTVLQIAAQVGLPYVSASLRDDDLLGNGTAKAYRNAMGARLKEAVQARNAAVEDPQDRIVAEQVMFVVYADGTKMATVLWIFFQEKDRERFEKCDFRQFIFFRGSDQPFEIKVPKITPNEMRFLQAQLPLHGPMKTGAIPPTEAMRFRTLYRYLPHFNTVDWG